MAGSRRSVACLMTLVSMCGPPITSSAVQPDARVEATTKEIARDLCGRQVVLLGESPTHGFGKTMQFKAELIRELVDGCRFNAVFFESGLYDFLNIETQIKSRGQVDGEAVAAAIGGLWANRDVEPLVPYLLEKARGGQLVIGGIDDQINRGTWSSGGSTTSPMPPAPRSDTISYEPVRVPAASGMKCVDYIGAPPGVT